MNATTFGLAIAKNAFFVHGTAQSGKVIVSRSLRRAQVLSFFSNAPVLIGIEACAGSHYWARELIRLGHTVKLLPAQYVRRYVQGNKTDANDAAAIAEAVLSPRIQAVAVNTPDQQYMQMLHRIRRRLVAQRCGLRRFAACWANTASSFPKAPGNYAGVWQGLTKARRPRCRPARVSCFLTCKRSGKNWINAWRSMINAPRRRAGRMPWRNVSMPSPTSAPSRPPPWWRRWEMPSSFRADAICLESGLDAPRAFQRWQTDLARHPQRR